MTPQNSTACLEAQLPQVLSISSSLRRAIAQELAALARHPTSRPTTEQLFDDSPAMDGILEIVRRRSGVDFRLYKPATIQRRLARRMAMQKRRDTVGLSRTFCGRIHGETDALFDDLLIKVTEFFRDAPVFEALKETAFPSLARSGSRRGANYGSGFPAVRLARRSTPLPSACWSFWRRRAFPGAF